MGKTTKTGGNGLGFPWGPKGQGGVVVGRSGPDAKADIKFKRTPARLRRLARQPVRPASPSSPEIVMDRPVTPLTERVRDIDLSASPRQPAESSVEQLCRLHAFESSVSHNIPRSITSDDLISITPETTRSHDIMNTPQTATPSRPPYILPTQDTIVRAQNKLSRTRNTARRTQNAIGRTENIPPFVPNKFQASDNMLMYSHPNSSLDEDPAESSQGQAGGQTSNQAGAHAFSQAAGQVANTAAGQTSNPTAAQGTTQPPPAQNTQAPPPQDGLPQEAMARARYNHILGMYQPHGSWHAIPGFDRRYFSRETLANRVKYLFEFMATPVGARAFSERINANARSVLAGIANTKRHIEFCKKQLSILDGIPVDMSNVIPPNGALDYAAGRDAIARKLAVDEWWLNIFNMELQLCRVANSRVVVARKATIHLEDTFGGKELAPEVEAEVAKIYEKFQSLRDEATRTLAGIVALVGEGRACTEMMARHRNELWDVWAGGAVRNFPAPAPAAQGA